MPRCYPNIYRCIHCLPWHCQSVLILWHFDCSLDFFNFSLRGTQIHSKKPAFFLDQLKASFSSNIYICPDCISCHLEFQNSPSPPAHAYSTRGHVSAYFQKFSIYLKSFWEPWLGQDWLYENHIPNNSKSAGVKNNLVLSLPQKSKTVSVMKDKWLGIHNWDWNIDLFF